VESERIAGGGEAVATVARGLRARLGEVAQAFGIQLPVYVLFTKADRLPFFADFVRNLNNEEAAQVLGVTLPLAPRSSSGIYAEEQTARTNQVFDELFHSLCNARPELLSRENDAAKLPGTYEFPREFRKLRASLVQFLVDLCRPSQLTVGPYLRGFYFSGVRPVIVHETAPAAEPRPAAQPRPAAAEATSMFRTPVGGPAAAPAAPQRIVGTRKVPQWVFLGHFFNDVLLADRVAMGASGASARTNTLRRVLLGVAAGLCLLFSVCFTVSYFRNRALESRIEDAVRGTATPPPAAAVASVDSLRRLETLRQSLDTLTVYHRDGAPLSYRWGLYAGDGLYPDVRRLYFTRFRQLLFGQTQASLLEYLRNLPATPGPGYGPTYDTLKAYLITTSHNEKSSREFLSPVLLNTWSANRNVDPERMQLAQKQFDFYSEELKTANPFSKENDGAAIEKARRYLAQFAGFERVYQAMLVDASKGNPPINFNRKFPGSAEVVVDAYEVKGPFTKGGWDFMKNAIKNPDRYFSGEQWVLGEQGATSIDRSKLAQQLQERYYSDFINQWRAYLKSAGVVRYANLKDAAQKLNLLSGNQSPLLALFWLASQNTAVDDPQVANAFQPVQAVVPSSSVDRYIAPPNQNYMNALVKLQTSLEAVAAKPEVKEDDGAATLSDATAARVTTRQLAQTFRLDPQGHVESMVQKLLEDPITNAEALLRTLGPAELNAKGKGLCGQFRAAMAKYPFNPNASVDATVDDVNAVFRKPDGALWKFYQESLQKLLPKQGSQYVAATSGGVTLTPAFVNFFNQAAAFSEALYAGGGQDPHLTYTLTPLPAEGIQSLGLQIDGQSVAYTGGNGAPKQFVWQGSGTHGTRATVKFGAGPDLAWSTSEGLWSVFRFIGKADHREPAPGGELLEWTIRIGKEAVMLPSNKPLTVRFELNMAGSPAVFQKGFFSRLACVAEVAKQ
jgi:type VI secretion system protein ImpL